MRRPSGRMGAESAETQLPPTEDVSEQGGGGVTEKKQNLNTGSENGVEKREKIDAAVSAREYWYRGEERRTGQIVVKAGLHRHALRKRSKPRDGEGSRFRPTQKP